MQRRGSRLRIRLDQASGSPQTRPAPVPWGHPDLVLAKAVAAG